MTDREKTVYTRVRHRYGGNTNHFLGESATSEDIITALCYEADCAVETTTDRDEAIAWAKESDVLCDYFPEEGYDDDAEQ